MRAKIIWAKAQAVITVVGGWLGYFMGGLDGMLMTLLVFMAIDYVTGVICAVIDKTLSSEVGFKGICKKVFILMLVGMANLIDIKVVGAGGAIRGAVICFYLSNEGVSIFENATRLGLPVPDKLRAILKQLHDKDEGDDDENDADDE